MAKKRYTVTYRGAESFSNKRQAMTFARRLTTGDWRAPVECIIRADGAMSPAERAGRGLLEPKGMARSRGNINDDSC